MTVHLIDGVTRKFDDSNGVIQGSVAHIHSDWAGQQILYDLGEMSAGDEKVINLVVESAETFIGYIRCLSAAFGGFDNDDPFIAGKTRTCALSSNTTAANTLVYVNLDTDNYDFDIANRQGHDILFYKDSALTELLGFYIDTWNAGSDAAIKVLLPDIGTDEFFLYYCNQQLISKSDERKVC